MAKRNIPRTKNQQLTSAFRTLDVATERHACIVVTRCSATHVASCVVNVAYAIR
jgi:hypothetical protein